MLAAASDDAAARSAVTGAAADNGLRSALPAEQRHVRARVDRDDTDPHDDTAGDTG